MAKQLLIIGSQNYNNNVLNAVIKISKNSKKTGYISLNKTDSAVIQMMKDKNIETDNFFFIDSVSAISSNKKKSVNTDFIDSLESFSSRQKLVDKIKNLVLRKGVDAIILDSVSSLFVYMNEKTALEWLNNLISFMEEKNANLFLFVLKDDANKTAIKQLEMRLDKSGKINDCFVFGSSTSPLVIASILTAVLMLSSAMIMFFVAAKPKITFNSFVKEQVTPLSMSWAIIAVMSFIFIYVLATRSRGVKNQ